MAPGASANWSVAHARFLFERQASACPFELSASPTTSTLSDVSQSSAARRLTSPRASVSSSLQRLQVGDDVLAILGTGNADDHLGPMHISGGIGEIFVELLLVPCDASGFEGG